MSVAILGAGACGLVAIKEVLEDGLSPKCFEIDSDLGGLWNVNRSSSSSSVYYSTVINTSKEMMCFSDFPMPKDFPSYCPHDKVLEYFRLYCDHFNLRNYIAFETRIDLIEKSDDFEETGSWKLTITDLKSKKVNVEIFDFVLICNGHHGDKNVPHINGQDLYKGLTLHSMEYFKPDGFEGKSVVVVGSGNSGCDMAVDLSRNSKQVYLVTRNGAWVLPRLTSQSYPSDMTLSRFINTYIPSVLKRSYIRSLVYSRANLDSYGMTPNHDIFSSHPCVNDELIGRIAVGRIKVKPNIQSITETGVVFVDGSEVQADAIAYCTGFSISYPFLAPGIIKVEDNQVDLYKYVFPPHLKGTLAVIGCVQPWGAINPIAELQLRWAMKVFKKELHLPSKSEMSRDISLKRRLMSQRYTNSRRHTVQVDYQQYCDEIAGMIGAKPNIVDLFLQDPKLWLQVLFGPITSYQFRLCGPHTWPGARDAILSSWKNTLFPSQTRILKPKPSFILVHHIILLFVVVFLAVYCIIKFI